RQWSVAPSVWCMPSPKMSRPLTMPGELTVGSLRYGCDLLHKTRFFAAGSVLIEEKLARLNAPRPEMNRRSFAGTGDALWWSFVLSVHRTLGVAGPGRRSVWRVRSGLPR